MLFFISQLIVILFLIIIIAIIVMTVNIVPQQTVVIVERFGKFHAAWNAGLHFKIPVIDMIANKVSLKERVLDFPPQGVITKDNITMQVDSVVFMQVFDAKKYTYGVENPIFGIENLVATNLRNVIGELTLDEALTSRDMINAKISEAIDQATDPWGIKVNRVELKDIQPPKEITDAMSKEMKAEREKRQALLEAEAHKQSIITRSEGDKEAKILAAQAEQEAQIALAKGKAESIKMVYEAEAQGLEKLNRTKVTESVLRLKGIEALKDIADGNSTKIFMPTEITQAVSSLGVLGEALGIGEATHPEEKPAPPTVIPADPCLDEDSSHISREDHIVEYGINKSLEGRR